MWCVWQVVALGVAPYSVSVSSGSGALGPDRCVWSSGAPLGEHEDQLGVAPWLRARGRRWADTCRAGSRPPWWTRGWNPTRGLVETPWNTRKRASRGRRLARSAAGARGLPAAARLVCARPARSVAVGASWLCRERPGPVTAERLVRSTLAVIAAGASPAADCRLAGTSSGVCRTARTPARPRMLPCLALRHRQRVYDVNQRHW